MQCVSPTQGDIYCPNGLLWPQVLTSLSLQRVLWSLSHWSTVFQLNSFDTIQKWPKGPAERQQISSWCTQERDSPFPNAIFFPTYLENPSSLIPPPEKSGKTLISPPRWETVIGGPIIPSVHAFRLRPRFRWFSIQELAEWATERPRSCASQCQSPIEV